MKSPERHKGGGTVVLGAVEGPQYTTHLPEKETLQDEIPEPMQRAQRWLVWRLEPGKTKPRKVPHYASGKRRGTTDTPEDHAQLVTMTGAIDAMQGGSYSGIGFALGNDGKGGHWQGVDFDHLTEHPELQSLVDSLPGYIERSPSGDGIHAIGYGRDFRSLGSNATGIEAYSGGRFFTVTGDSIGGGLEDISAFVENTLAPRHGSAHKAPKERPHAVKAGEPVNVSAQTIKDLRSALKAIPADDYNEWINVGQGLKTIGEQGRELWVEWSQKSDKWTPEDADRWDTFTATKTSYKAVFTKAKEHGWHNPADDVTFDFEELEMSAEELAAIKSTVEGWGARAAKAANEWPEIVPLPTPGDLATASDYPLAPLSEAIKRAAGEVARFVKVPVASPAVVALSVLAVALGKRARIEERPGLYHWPALFLAAIAASGERKSPVFKALTSPLEDWAEDQREEWEALRLKVKAKDQAIDLAISGLKAQAKKSGAGVEAIAEEIEEQEKRRIILPASPSLFTTDVTEQRLFQKMHERGGAYAVLSGEGRPVFDAIMGKYSGDGRTGDGIYLAGVTGDTITRDRVGGEGGPEERVIRNPALNVCLMVQPDKYLEAAAHPRLRASGALARIWPVFLPSLVGRRLEEEGEPGIQDAELEPFRALVRSILDHVPESEGEEPPKPHLVRLSPEAARLRREFHNLVERMQGQGEELEDCRDIASKATSQACKLAMVLHLAESPELLNQPDSTLSARTWTAAQELGTYHLTEAVRVQRQADEDPMIEGARRLVDWITRERITELRARDLQRSGPRPRPNATGAARLLDLLEDHGYLVRKMEPGKTKPLYLVNPAVLSPLSPLSPGGRGESEK